jgi:hypothetical protein
VPNHSFRPKNEKVRKIVAENVVEGTKKARASASVDGTGKKGITKKMILDSRHICKGQDGHHQDIARHDAMEAAGRIAGNPGPYRVSKSRPCPVCGREKWCCSDPISGVCLCAREASGALQDGSFRPIRFSDFGFLHVRGAASIYAGGPPPRRAQAGKTAPATTNSEQLARIQAVYRTSGQHLVKAGKELGLPAAALEVFAFGRFSFWFSDAHENCKTWTWPERTATGDVCGIGHRRQGDGEKRFQGHRGIVLTEAHAADRERLKADIIARGRVVAPEGLTDSVVVHAMGEVAIGRPSVSGGVAAIAALLLALDLPESVEVIVCGENDQVDGATWVGRDIALEAARRLAAAIGYRHRVVVAMPPAGVKDLRAAWQAGFTTWAAYIEKATILETAVTLHLDSRHLAYDPSCPNSGIVEKDTLCPIRDKGGQMQSDGLPNARYLAWNKSPEMKRARAAWQSNPWDCPDAFGTAGLENLSPVLITSVCGKRSCPVCGVYWKLKTFRRFGFYVFAHDGQLYADRVSDFDWPAIVKNMRRRTKRLGVPLRYVAVRGEDDNLTVISSVFVRPDVARPCEKAEALDLLERAVETAAMGARPINNCREWRPLDKREVERVSGGCSPGAFRETVAAWGATAEGFGGRFLKCDTAGLFLSPESKSLDKIAMDDFWFEGWLRDTEGSVEADDFHRRAGEQRERIAAATVPPRPPPAAATCNHQDVAETVTFDGFANRQCTTCGEDLGCRKLEAVT